MSGWSPRQVIAMERRHVLEGKKRIARQEALVKKMVEQGHEQLAYTASQILDVLRQSLELSRERLRYLEGRYDNAPASN
jgi:hypothetical protein